MRKKALLAFYSFLGIILFLAAALLILRYWVQRETFRKDLSQSLSEKLGSHVEIGKILLNPLKGLEVKGFKIQNPAPHNGDAFLAFDRAFFNYSLQSLLFRQLVIQNLVLMNPAITIQFYSDDSSNLPHTHSVTTKSTSSSSLSYFFTRASLDRFALQNGSFRLINAQNTCLCEMQGIQAAAHYSWTSGASKASGDLTLASLILGGFFKIHDIHSNIQFGSGKLTLPDIQGKAYDGTATGSLESTLTQPKPTFSLKLKLTDVDISTLQKELGHSKSGITGKLGMTAQLEGLLQQPRQLTGTGEMEIPNPNLTHFQLFQEIAQILDLPDLENLKFKHFKGTFKVGDEKITFFNLEAVSEDLQITGAGTMTFEQELDFDMAILLSQTTASHLPDWVRKQMMQREDGSYTLTFKLIGTLEDPKTNLNQKFAQAAIQKLEELKLPENVKKNLPNILNKYLKSSQPSTPENKEPAPSQPAPPQVAPQTPSIEPRPPMPEEKPSEEQPAPKE